MRSFFVMSLVLVSTVSSNWLSANLEGRVQDKPVKTAHELEGSADHWFNTEKPVKLAELKGKVVWLEFSYLG